MSVASLLIIIMIMPTVVMMITLMMMVVRKVMVMAMVVLNIMVIVMIRGMLFYNYIACCYTGCICLTFLRCVFSDISST